jgi:hypothetical protein
MAAVRTIEIPLPEGMNPSGIDVELLKATFQAIASLRCECDCEWKKITEQLECEGWKVRWGLSWVAEAQRGEDYEQARGRTMDEALQQLQQLTRLSAVGGCP